MMALIVLGSIIGLAYLILKNKSLDSKRLLTLFSNHVSFQVGKFKVSFSPFATIIFSLAVTLLLNVILAILGGAFGK